MAKDQLFTAEWFPYYFERFEGSDRVAAMSLAVEGAYHRAIRHAWRFGSVPSDPKMLAARIQKGCTIPIAKQVLEMFEEMPGVPSRAIHPTIEEIRAEQRDKFLSSRKKGLAGAEARWGKRDDASPAAEKPEKDAWAIAQPMPDKEERHETGDKEKESFPEIDSYVQACVREFSDADPHLVEIAVLESVIRRKGSLQEGKPIRSPKAYFRGEIEAMVQNGKKLSARSIEVLLRRRREQCGVSAAKAVN